MDRLLAAAALAVDGHGGDRLWKRGCEHHVATYVEALLADLPDAADDDVVDRRRVDPRALDERVEYGRAQIDRVPVA